MREKLVQLICDSACEGNEKFGNCPERMLGKCISINRLEMCQVNALTDHLLADEEIKHAFELLKAEKEGRLYEAPCKVGDIVFLLYSNNEKRGINPIRVCALIFGENEFIIRGTDCGCDIWELHEDRLGKDVFVDFEDVEKAWEKLEGN